MKRLEEENFVNKQIQVHFPYAYGDRGDFNEALALIDEGKHPFLHSFISTMPKDLFDEYDS